MEDGVRKENTAFSVFITTDFHYTSNHSPEARIDMPATPDEVKAACESIGVKWGSSAGEDRDYFVAGIEGDFEIDSEVGRWASLDDLNYLACSLQELTPGEHRKFRMFLQMGDYAGSVKDMINLTKNLNQYAVLPGVKDFAGLGRYYVKHYLASQPVMEEIAPFIKYDKYGKSIHLQRRGAFLEGGYVFSRGRMRFVEYYDGKIESIPPKYRVRDIPAAHERYKDVPLLSDKSCFTVGDQLAQEQRERAQATKLQKQPSRGR